MSDCAEKLCLNYFKGLANTPLSQRRELKHEAAFYNRQLCGLTTDSLALSFVLHRYNVLLFVLCAICYGITWVKLLHYWHTIVGETYFMSEDLNEILQNSSNEEYRENKNTVKELM